ncbi:cysteine-rich repeat secretory protein 38-like [Alnus glutinosa]|uniref:cysteine-rich repeat secretory protein 38-like n=1 Tax=Alnus glutinosa TaxID=3517 RepID=UPI002D768053|nr:cysteine-rich repeat secretory protein 38-like [Alnus glutinosa]
MAFLTFALSLYQLSFILLLQTVFGADPIFHICSTSDNFTRNDPYDINLRILLGYLSFETPPTGYSFSSMGESQSQVFGLALCRGDVSYVDCASCVIEASNKVRDYCSYNKNGIIWYENCLVKYANNSFFGKIDYENMVYAWAVQNASDPSSFNPKVRNLLTELANQASGSRKMYKAGSLEIGEGRRVYGLTQCTRDISGSDCKVCLEEEIRRQPDCCDGKQGGRIMSGSCYFRYDVSPFVNESMLNMGRPYLSPFVNDSMLNTGEPYLSPFVSDPMRNMGERTVTLPSYLVAYILYYIFCK